MSMLCSPAPEALPTLLTSRRHKLDSGKSLAKPCSVTQAPPKLPEAYTMPVRIRNTFIDTSAERSPSLERFYKEREVSTCPSSHIGRFRSLFTEATSGHDDDDMDTYLPSEAPDTRSVSEASPFHATSTGPASLVISLASALVEPYHPLGVPTRSTQASLESSAIDGAAAYTTDAAYNHSFGGECFSWSELAHARLDSTYCWSVEEGRAGIGDGLCLAGNAWAEGAQLPPAVTEPRVLPAAPDHPALGSAEMPSRGSAGHAAGGCKPCAFFHKDGCKNGLACPFCHLCGPDARKSRRKAKLEARRAERLGRAGSQESAKDLQDQEAEL